jgi:glycosyltransferase involved in cell wall biosynthesis
MSSRLRLAYFSPLPPARSGIADYSQELLPYLAQHMLVALFTDNPHDVPEEMRAQYPIYPTGAYPSQRWAFDVALYQMGNSSHHERMYEMLLRYPGIVVLHDYGLHHFIVHWTIGNGRPWAYVRELGYALGSDGVQLAHEAIGGQKPYPVFDIPLNDRLLDISLGVIVHSQYTQARVLARSPALPVAAIPAPIAMVGPPGSSGRVEEWPVDRIVLASVGGVTRAKQLDQALRAFARVRQVVPLARYLIIGEWFDKDVNVPALLTELGLNEVARCTGYVSDLKDFAAEIASADIAVNLRNPTVGETSATALRALAAGRPLIVTDHGWYSELPDSVCLKVPPDDEEALFDAMLRLATDAELRKRMGQDASKYATDTHSPAKVADAYAGFIRRVLDADSRVGVLGRDPMMSR